MTNAEIKCQLWELLTAADKLKARRSRRFGWLAFVVALPVGVLLGGILGQMLSLGDTAGIWSWVLGGVAATLGTAMHAVKKDGTHAAKLAAKFRSLFPEGNGDFQTAVKLVKQFQTDSKVEKDLIKALGTGIKHQEIPVEVLKAKLLSKALSKDGIKSGLPHAPPIKSIEDFFALMEKDPNFSGKFTKTTKKSGNGVQTSVEVVSSSFTKPNTAAAAPANELLGGFEDKQGGASPAKTESDKPARPAAEPRYIPLDPYERPADEDADAGEPGPKNARR